MSDSITRTDQAGRKKARMDPAKVDSAKSLIGEGKSNNDLVKILRISPASAAAISLGISPAEYRNSLVRGEGHANYTAYLDHLAREKGYANHSAYHDEILQRRGFSGRKQYRTYMRALITDLVIPALSECNDLTVWAISRFIKDKYGFEFNPEYIKKRILNASEKETNKKGKKFTLTINKTNDSEVVRLKVN
jgi:hypothetical protein